MMLVLSDEHFGVFALFMCLFFELKYKFLKDSNSVLVIAESKILLNIYNVM